MKLFAYIKNLYMRCLPVIIMITILIFTYPIRAKASIFHVPKDFSTIQSALDNAQKGDIIKVSAGLYKENLIWPNIAGIQLIGRQQDTIVDANHASHVIAFHMTKKSSIDNQTLISGFQIQNGKAPKNCPYGGGIYVKNASPVIRHLIIMNNYAERGGGIYCEASHMSIDHSIISKNFAINAGAIYCYDARPLLSHNIITFNKAAQGSALSLFYSNVRMGHSTLMDNISNADSQFTTAIFSYDTSLDINESIIWNIKTSDEIYCSEFSNHNQILISHTNIQKGKEGIHQNCSNELIWKKGNISKLPKPFGLHMGKTEKDTPKINITNKANVSIHGQGGIPNAIEILANGEKITEYTKNVSNDTFTIQVPLQDGTHTITAQYPDEHSDTPLESDPIIITVDTTPPTILGIRNDPYPKPSKTWKWNAKDADSNIRYRFIVDQQLNSLPTESYTTTNTITISPPDYHDGQWYLHVQAIDTARNESPVTTVSAVLDATLPVMTGLESRLTPVQKINWDWNAEDQMSGIQYRYLIDQHIHSHPKGEFSEKNSVEFIGDDGVWYLHVQAKDLAGNLSEIVTVSSVIDTRAPEISGLTDDPFPSKKKAWAWNVKDSDPHVMYRYTISQDSHPSFSGLFVHRTKTTLHQTNGKWYLHVQAKDRAGNMSKIKTVSAILDNVPPEILGLKDDDIPAQHKQWSWEVRDSDQQIRCRYIFNQKAIATLENDFCDVKTAEIHSTDGKWYLHVQAVDRAGNKSKLVSVSSILDNTPPVIFGLKNDLIPSQDVQWNWQGKDQDTNIIFRFHISQSPDHQFSLQDHFTNKHFYHLSNKEGQWFLHVQAKDTAGNVSDQISVFAMLDNTPPKITGIVSDDRRMKEKKWSWNGDDVDQQILYRYTIDSLPDSSPKSAYTKTTSVLLNDLNGTFYLHLQAIDRAGNSSEIIHAKTVLDISPPIITGLEDDLSPCQSKFWFWKAKDQDRSILYRFSVNTNESSIVGGQFSALTQTSIAHENGMYYLHVQAKDSAGNLSKIKTVSTLLDNISPVIQGLKYDHVPKKTILWNWQIIDNDPNTLSRFQINQQSNSEIFGPFQNMHHINLSDKNGRWFIHVQAKDTAGNLSDITCGSAVLDNVAPKILGLKNDLERVQQKIWRWYAEDADSIIHYRFLIHNTPQTIIPTDFQRTSTTTITHLEGIWYLNIQAKDRAGNLSPVISVSTHLDAIPPIIKGLSNDSIPKKQKEWSWYASDDDTFISFRYTIDQQKDGIPVGLFESKTNAFLSDVDGIWFIHVQGKDRAGNISDTITVSAILDNTSPEIIHIVDDFIPKKTKIWSWHARDEDSQIMYRFNVDSSRTASLISSYTDTCTTTISGENGIFYLNIQAKDRAGNLSEPVSVKAVLDNTPPIIQNLDNEPHPQKMKKWQWQADDQDTQILYRYIIDEHAESLPTGAFTHTTHASIASANGLWYLHVQARDSAGNLSQVKTVSVQLDISPPVITGLSNDTNPTQAKHWMWSARDNDTNLLYRYVMNQIDQLQLNNSYSTKTNAEIHSTDGKWYLHVQAKDSAGNESEIVTVSAILDNIPPVISGLTNDQMAVKKKTWVWNALDKDATVIFRHQVSQEQQPVFTSSFSQSNSASVADKNGKWYLHVQAKDRAGNFSEPLSVYVFFDNIRPVIQGLVNDEMPKRRKQWQWQAKDTDTFIQYRYLIDQIPHSNPNTVFDTVNTAEQIEGNGLWYLHVQAKDTAGNLSDVVTVSAILDNTPPVISGLLNDDIPKKSHHWTWTIEDNDPEILCRYAVDQNDFFSTTGAFQKRTNVDISGLEGKYYLHVQAKDRAHNVSELMTVYAILDQTPPVITGLVDDRIPKKLKQWQWGVIDRDSKILYRYIIDQHVSTVPKGSFSDVMQAELSQPDGQWYIHVQAKDRAGHLSDIVSVSTIIDNSPPLIKGLQNDTVPCFSKIWQWSADDMDTEILFRYIVSPKNDATLSGVFTKKRKVVFNQREGKSFIKVQAQDRAGNISDIVTVSAIIDRTPPVVKGLSNDINPCQQKKWHWKAIDADSDIRFRYVIDQNPHSSLDGAFRNQISANIQNENGTYYIHVQEKDRAGNLSKIVDAYAVFDNIPPKILGIYDDIIPRMKKKWEWNADDHDSHIEYRYTINQSAHCQLNSPFTQNNQSEIIQQKGQWYIHVQAKDRADNISEIQTAYTIIDEKNKGLYINLHIHFDSNKDFTEILFIDAIKRIAKILQKYPDTKAIIEAHCDNTGDEAFNQKLSKRRAQNVRSILIKKYKISSSRLEAVGYGATRPIADNSTEKGRRENRRADAYIYHVDEY